MTLAQDMVVHTSAPLNAEPPLHRLCAAFVTPRDYHYVRSHGEIPHVDVSSYRLRVDAGLKLAFSLAELQQRFTHHSVMATLQCAGNRRADQQQVRPTLGDPWSCGAIGNAVWTGVRLGDVLQAADALPDGHVAFEAMDEAAGHPFGVSIPMDKARAPEVLLAWAMNDAPLAPEHGAPLRLVVPGYAGVRSPKWLSRITVQDAPSANPMQAQDYKLVPPDVTAETVDWDAGLTINAMPVNSAICQPHAFAAVAAGPTPVHGWAHASGRGIARVDVSGDGGRSWRQAALEHPPGSPWAWTLWRASVDLQPGERELVVRAWDDAGQTQPSAPDETWNFKGYLSAAWHRVRITVG